VSFYPDANFVLRLCIHAEDKHLFAETERALRWLARRELPVRISPLTIYETRKHLWGLTDELRQAAERRLLLYLSEWEAATTNWDGAVERALHHRKRVPRSASRRFGGLSSRWLG